MPFQQSMRCLALACAALAWLVPRAAGAGEAPLTDAALVREALAHNPELRAARAERDAARARVPQSAALEEPMLEAGLVNAPLPSLDTRSEDMTMRMLGLSQKLPFPGKRPLRRAAAEAGARALAQAGDDLALQVARDVRMAAARLRRIEALDPLLRATRATLAGLSAQAEARYGLGLAPQADVLAAQAEVARLDGELLSLAAEHEVEQAGLAQLLGRAPAQAPIALAPVAVTTDAGAAGVSAPPADAGPLLLAADARPQLRALESLGERARQELALARRERYPDFELRLQYGQRQPSANGMRRPDMVTLTVAMNLPIHGEARQGPRIAEARAQAERADALLESARQQSRGDIARQLAQWRAAAARLALARDTLLPQAEALCRAQLAAYRNGAGSFADVLAAQLRQLEVERGQLDDRLQAESARLELDRLAGTAPAPIEGDLP